MIVCVDTNVLIQARAESHPYGVILDAFMLGSMQWAVSTRVLQEYQEIDSAVRPCCLECDGSFYRSGGPEW